MIGSELSDPNCKICRGRWVLRVCQLVMGRDPLPGHRGTFGQEPSPLGQSTPDSPKKVEYQLACSYSTLLDAQCMQGLQALPKVEMCILGEAKRPYPFLLLPCKVVWFCPGKAFDLSSVVVSRMKMLSGRTPHAPLQRKNVILLSGE
ncbi:hypothetical protein Pfo_000514 [Paulownia fortunei]|nr:hypothetical protein Pfo_000514 [Paulownia fortunei]